MLMDGKYLAKEKIILMLGVTLQGDNIPWGFVHAPSEHSGPVMDLLRDLKQRGLQGDKGLLFVIDGSKDFRKAMVQISGSQALIQRCKWHKRENVLAYLPEKEQQPCKKDFHEALTQSN